MWDFKWAPLSQYVRYEQLSKHGLRQMVNHLQAHSCLSSKDLLFENLCKYFEHASDRTVWDVVPLTFVVDFTQRYPELEKFTSVYTSLQKDNDLGSV